MVFHKVCEGSQKQEMWHGGRQNETVMDLHKFVYGFCMVREGSQNQEIWPGERRQAKIINWHSFAYGFPQGSGGRPKT